MNTTEPLYDVVIYEKATRRIDAIIGKNLRRYGGPGSGYHSVELRVQTGKERINDRYGCKEVEAGKYRQGDTIT